MHNKKVCSLLWFLLLIICNSTAQVKQQWYCGFDSQSNRVMDSIDGLYTRTISRSIAGSRSTVLKLPVVVHIVHNNGPENISDALVLQAIADLNDAFRNRGYYNPLTGVDTEIEFCLARRDTLGRAINGIIRHESALTDMSTHYSNAKLAEIASYNPDQYINIRIVKDVCLGIDCNRKGYAVNGLLGSQKFRNGITLEYNVVGKSSIDDVILIHEMGHYLGLYHTFNKGCKNDNCLVDGDKVCDTPPDDNTSPFACNFDANSCKTDEDDSSIYNPFRSILQGGLGDQYDQHRNYMDYASTLCSDRFTMGQSARMRWFINEVFPTLLSSHACKPPCEKPIDLNCFLDKSIYIVGEPILLNQTLTNVSIPPNYSLEGKKISDLPKDLQNLPIGEYRLKVNASPSDQNCAQDSCLLNFKVVCPVFADFEYFLKDSILIFENTSKNFNSYQFKVYKDNTLLYTSTSNIDSIKILDRKSYTVFVIASNGICSDSIMKSISLSEICDNGLDDDEDGLVDYYDKDCKCIDSLFYSSCINICHYLPDSFPTIKTKLKWKTKCLTSIKMFGSLALSITTDENFIYSRSSSIYKDSFINSISLISRTSGEVEKTINIDTSIFSYDSNILIFKSEDKNYIITRTYIGEIICYENEKLKWVNRNFIFQFQYLTSFKSADFNFDGTPEIYFADKILNLKQGILIFDGNYSKGCNYFTTFTVDLCQMTHSIAADLTSSPGLELACGNVVYEIKLINLNDTFGNSSNVIFAPSSVNDGFTSIADINSDGLLDVIIVRNNEILDGGIWVWDPRQSKIISSAKSLTKNFKVGGVATIDDLNNDCFPEIIVVYNKVLLVLSYIGSDTLKPYFSIATSDNSGITGSTVFDLNQDGIKEVIYRDETEFMIINGLDGTLYETKPLLSVTGSEYPIICDIDNDNQAEILVSGGIENRDSVRIFCFESATTPWAPARKVWNQSGYHITNVNDDLTIPRQQQNNAAFFDTDSCAQQTCNQPYNSFMCQATYRDQNGCVNWPAVDMMADILDYTCQGDSVTLKIEVRNQSTNTFKQDSVNLALYNNADNLPFVMRQLSWDKTKKADTISITLSNIGLNKVKARVNIPDGNTSYTSNIKGLTPVLECDYDNNSDSLALDLAKKTLDLGPDITKCRTQVFTLHAGSGFVSYFWSDGSQDSTYTTSDAGVHKVVAYDMCNRKYEDEVTFNIDNALIPFLADIEKCEGDTINIQTTDGFNIVQWLPAQNIVCDTCNATKIVGDTAFNLIMVTEKNGCIDADTARVSIKPLQKKTITASLCEGFTYNFYNKTLSSAGQYTHRTGQCDSLITLDLKINKRDTTTLTQQICKGDSILVFGKYYSQAINATFKGSNVYGCDSIVNVNLSVLDTIRSSNKISLCDGDSIRINSQWIDKAGSYNFNYKSIRGCDSIATYQLSLLPNYTDLQSYSICKDDSIKIGTVVYNKAGLYTQLLKSAQGCDSTLTITISTLPSALSKDTLSLCTGDSILVFGTYKKTSGTFSKAFTAANGCDSTAAITIKLRPLPSTKDSISICEGDSVVVFGKYISKAGTYQQVYTSAQGCDSTSVIELSIAPFIRANNNIKLCDGDTVMIGGKAITQAGTILDTTIVNGNCKKITSHTIEIVSAITNALAYQLCPEDSIKINNIYYTDAGTYTIALQSTIGCDSILIATIAKLSWPDKPIIEVDCDKEVYKATMVPSEPWTYTWPDGSNASSYNFDKGGKLTVKASTPSGCEKSFTQDLPDIPGPSDIPTLTDKTITSGNGIDLSVPLDPKHWKVQWSPLELTSCDTCFNTTITADRDTTITVRLMHESGCTYIELFRLLVNDTSVISLPNVFYPSSSSINNAWSITLPKGYTISEVNVYDRWADKVYSAKNTNEVSWDGTFNGQAVLPGVYVYQIKIIDKRGGVIIKVGDVTVVR